MSEKKSWFGRLKAGLQKSSSRITDGISSIIAKRKLDHQVLEELEELLIQADMGVNFAVRFTENLSKGRFQKEVSDAEIKAALAAEMTPVLEKVEGSLIPDPKNSPHVVLVVGVNGSGKTTTIGKLAKDWTAQGLKVRMVAADTFRAAAVEQLQEWGHSLNVPVVAGPIKGEAAALVFDALMRSRKEKDDVLIIDTAGRLQNKTSLMEELSKIERVIQKIDPKAPHSGLLVLDATVGQNAYSQVEAFSAAVKVSHLVMTKLDGTARGGVLVGLADRFNIPVHAIGVGEKASDLKHFVAKDFSQSLVGLSLSSDKTELE